MLRKSVGFSINTSVQSIIKAYFLKTFRNAVGRVIRRVSLEICPLNETAGSHCHNFNDSMEIARHC